ncbi:hypothetical protein TorRG33x02_176660, partial [Trema orientale]
MSFDSLNPIAVEGLTTLSQSSLPWTSTLSPRIVQSDQPPLGNTPWFESASSFQDQSIFLASSSS